ncbi:MAG: hypothetical protein M3483_07165 [Gemmatimonadota bacterium]|nr:hypothetical protein [Gemmatimonadota bacterium]
MFKWLVRKRLTDETRRRVMIATARSEEAILDTHVENALELLDELDGEVSLDHGLELYLEMMALDEPFASTVSNRVLAQLENTAPRGVVVRGRRFENIFRHERSSGRARKRR